MQLILLERVEGLGNVGDEVNVRAGYGRNFLLPKGKATEATTGNRRIFERRRAQLELKQAEVLAQAKEAAVKLSGLSLEVVRATSDGKHLYGSVGSAELATLLAENGYTVERRHILLDQPIKEVGTQVFRVRLHPDVTADVSIQVAAEQH
ncbi:MAG: 50S ribosomal protein L9 [Zetaproteobacteria bacterium CG12_big_fil_rev_8_21_14_0_65_54_13]|nr:MAG: 50S ribosomal protein L9 [Zetaproteobacteria bacterium CG23_combo_of_CG06-09_8_20_14_all_54_7]PIW44055.1 MAG: 50S ribosomal protein L9 [Zetaproteobacteria bacterium CG12_big_fil_rev_8_21_14_0_65_54_13]PIX54733.1 MAG: 50S ribosomal protein L9 [Zetaproteobacteria bacterium CG_4_10_14_3_um_filter_54_28]PJA29373.1 MAG: 50S ribosomal protein L9 [Zetaproteobacteria bacterium CG_4_9_14_3_um_filter_54_145]